MQKPLPAQALHSRRAVFLAGLAGVLALGATAWLWMQHGMTIYATQIATFAWSCL
ncbi:MAG: hypothetical protein MUE79_05200 [Nitratireductor sp.]|nr:hypothetical protein [Nitratireductor sp.]